MIPYLEIQKKIYALLSGDATLTALVPEIGDFIPQQTTFPFVKIGTPEANSNDAIAVRSQRCQIQIDTWVREPTRGKAPVYDIMAAINAVLNDSQDQFNLTNSKVISFYESFSTVLEEGDTVTYHGVQRFSFVLVEKCARD